MSRFFARSIVVVSVLGLTACSAFNRRNGASVDEEAKTSTPLDMPAKPATEAPPEQTAADAAAAPKSGGPQVTLVKKDGTVLNADGTPLKTDKPAATENTPGKMPVTGQMIATPAEASATATDAAAATVAVSDTKNWSYSGETGPDHWAAMNNDYSACGSGKTQSPIDLKWHKPVKASAMSANYKSSKAFVSDNGHSIQMAFDMGGSIKIKGQTYDLMQVHFHSPSEHTLSGKQFPLEAHFVHKNADGKTVVLAAFFKEGKENAVITKIWNAIPNPPAPASANDMQISAKDLMPPMKTYYEYTGSMTTPPCTEDIHWMVFNTPLNISKAQIETLHKFHADNNRPTQSLNDRKVINH
jgi:carbonic anhydrase